MNSELSRNERRQVKTTFQARQRLGTHPERLCVSETRSLVNYPGQERRDLGGDRARMPSDQLQTVADEVGYGAAAHHVRAGAPGVRELATSRLRYAQTFRTGRGPQAIIERNEGHGVPKLVLEMKTTGKLDGITGAKRVPLKEQLGSRDDLGRELHDEHGGHVGLETGQCAVAIIFGEDTFAYAAHQRRHDLDRRQPARRRHS